jgi:predicted nucleotidyltransferase
VTRYWPLLSGLRRALRTERRVRLALLFRSIATGNASRSSDVDLLVAGHGLDPLERVRLAARLAQATGRRVQLVLLDEALASPTLLADVLEEGRVLIDRDRRWRELKREEGKVLREAQRAEELIVERASGAVADARARLA